MSEEQQKNKPNMPEKDPDSDQQKGNQGFQWKQAGKTSLIWVIILISAIFVSGLFTGKGGDELELEYWEYEHFLNSELIATAEIIQTDFQMHQIKPEAYRLKNLNHYHLRHPCYEFVRSC